VAAADAVATASGANTRTAKQTNEGGPMVALVVSQRFTVARRLSSFGAEPAQTSEGSGGSVHNEGGGCSPHPVGGGARARCSVAAA
jgi:hypothetical protein